MEELGAFGPVSSLLCAAPRLSPPLLAGARQTDLAYPGVVGGWRDEERFMSVSSFLTVRGGLLFPCSDQKVRRKRGERAGD